MKNFVPQLGHLKKPRFPALYRTFLGYFFSFSLTKKILTEFKQIVLTFISSVCLRPMTPHSRAGATSRLSLIVFNGRIFRQWALPGNHPTNVQVTGFLWFLHLRPNSSPSIPLKTIIESIKEDIRICRTMYWLNDRDGLRFEQLDDNEVPIKRKKKSSNK